MADNFGVYNITGRVEAMVSSSVEKALEPLSGNLNIRRGPERELYKRTLLGTALRSEVGQALESQPNQGMSVDANTVALWRLDEPLSSSQPRDEVAGRTLSVFGATVPPNVTGQIGLARFVSSSAGGLGQWISGVGDAALGTAFSGSGWSIETWINPSFEVAGQLIFIYNGLNFTLDPNHMILAQFGYFPTGSTGRLGLTQWVTNNPATSQNRFSTGTISSGSWSHVALTRELQTSPANRYTFRFYINGQLDSTHTDVTGQMASTSGSGHFIGFGGYVGSLGFGTPIGAPYIGKMDEMRISNRARTAAEILDSYQRGTGSLPQYATIPSWTQTPGTKKRHAFVIATLSSSQHAVSSLNAVFSGTQALEISPVPASGNMYYSKGNRFQKLVYKLSASAGLPELPGNTRPPSHLESPGGRATFSLVSGSYRNNHYFRPAVFNINIPEYGKIRDVKVWVELIHDHRGGTGTGSANASNPFYAGGSGSTIQDTRVGLQGLQIALRSPNVNFENAHPMWNDKYVLDREKGPDFFNSFLTPVPDLLKGTYLLWAGHQVEQDLGETLGSLTSSAPDNKNVYQTIYQNISGSFSSLGDICIDQYGKTHVVYASRDSGSITYASSSIIGVDWSSVRLSGGAGFGGVDVGKMSIAVGKNNHRHIVFDHSVAGNAMGIRHVRITGTFEANNLSKTIALVTPSSPGLSGPGNASLAIDANDAPCLAYDFVFTPGIFMARSGATGFVTEQITQPLVERYTPTLFFDSSGSPEVFYSAFDGSYRSTLMHARSGSTTGWAEYTVFSGGLVPDAEAPFALNVSSFIGMARDSNGGYHAAVNVYFYASEEAMRAEQGGGVAGIVYLRSGSSGWAAELIASCSVRSHNSDTFSLSRRSISIGPNGVPQIVFQRNTNSTTIPTQILYARSSSLGWSVQELTSGENTGNNFLGPHAQVIAVDSANDPHVMYVDRENSSNSTPGTTGSLSYVRLKGSVSGAAYFSFDKDIDMRTVFDDGSPNSNPRHIQDLYRSPTPSSPGSSLFPSLRLLRGGSYPSPLSGAVALFGISGSYRALRPYEGGAPIDQVHFMTGANFPWMLDSRIPPGNFVGRQYSATASFVGDLSSSHRIPEGWLTGIGGANNTNEWPTKGIQLGPATIKPVYPLLDDIFVEKMTDQTPRVQNSQFGLTPATIPTTHPRIVGFRPGLRGTEVNGTWKLLIGNTWDADPGDPFGGPATGSIRGGFWFRQFRLEFTIDTGQGQTFKSNPGHGRLYQKRGHVPFSANKRTVSIMSGSAQWDTGVNFVTTTRGDEFGVSAGITSKTGSTDFAVYSQLTGTLVTVLSASGKLDGVRASFLSNEFGTPYVPVTSGSGEAPTFDAFTSEDALEARQTFQEILVPTTLVPRDNTLRAFLARSRTALSTRDAMVEKLKK